MSEVCTSTSTGGVECETKPYQINNNEVSTDTNYFGLSLPLLLAIILTPFGVLFLFFALKRKNKTQRY
jgi:hypothetical protein